MHEKDAIFNAILRTGKPLSKHTAKVIGNTARRQAHNLSHAAAVSGQKLNAASRFASQQAANAARFAAKQTGNAANFSTRQANRAVRSMANVPPNQPWRPVRDTARLLWDPRIRVAPKTQKVYDSTMNAIMYPVMKPLSMASRRIMPTSVHNLLFGPETRQGWRLHTLAGAAAAGYNATEMARGRTTRLNEAVGPTLRNAHNAVKNIRNDHLNRHTIDAIQDSIERNVIDAGKRYLTEMDWPAFSSGRAYLLTKLQSMVGERLVGKPTKRHYAPLAQSQLISEDRKNLYPRVSRDAIRNEYLKNRLRDHGMKATHDSPVRSLPRFSDTEPRL